MRDEIPPAAPAPAALAARPEDLTDLLGLVKAAEQPGWTPVCAHVSDTTEWDNCKSSWCWARYAVLRRTGPWKFRGEHGCGPYPGRETL